MLRRRERLFAALFSVQLLAAVIFGGVLVHGLKNRPSTSTLAAGGTAGTDGTADTVDGGSTDTASTDPSAAPGASAAASAAPGATAAAAGGTTTTGGKAGGPTAAGGTGSVIAPGAPIKIGSIVTQSGAINFKSSAQGTKAYIDMVNAAGGVAGHKIQLIQDDDQLSSSTGLNEFKTLHDQGVFAYAAFNAPNTEGSIKKPLDSYGIPLIGDFGEYDEYQDNLSIGIAASGIHYGYEMGLYLKALGVKTPALLYVTNNDSRSDAEILKGFTDGFGGPPKYTAVKQPTDTYQSDVTTMRQDNVDGLASLLDTGSYTRYLQAAGSFAQQIKHVASPLYVAPSVEKLSNADGAYIASDFSFPDSTDAAVGAYRDAVNAEFGSAAQIDYEGVVGWTDAKLLVDGLKAMNGVFTQQGLLDAIDGFKNYQSGLTGALPFGKGVRDISTCIQFGKLTSGKVVQTQDYTCDATEHA